MRRAPPRRDCHLVGDRGPRRFGDPGGR
jgi:hypothetical protein